MDLTAENLEIVLAKVGKNALSDAELGIIFEAYNLLFPLQKRGFTRCGSCVREVTYAVKNNLQLIKTLIGAGDIK